MAKGLEAKQNQQVRNNVENRYRAHKRILQDISSGFKEIHEEKEKEPLRQLDPDKMNSFQLLSEGFKRMDEQQKEEEK
ncbi:hypothetical protein [Lentibacillus saliphilus]|uniref:hypothetical protein n=1 Tax=Lentibacillus saliphilus TaxID=2737028 RepID=UPI001C2F212B|nr:hypothetical protein [Lentibacillus saliphilus]